MSAWLASARVVCVWKQRPKLGTCSGPSLLARGSQPEEPLGANPHGPGISLCIEALPACESCVMCDVSFEALPNREQTASLQTALLLAIRATHAVRTQMRSARLGSIPIAWISAIHGPVARRERLKLLSEAGPGLSRVAIMWMRMCWALARVQARGGGRPFARPATPNPLGCCNRRLNCCARRG